MKDKQIKKAVAKDEINHLIKHAQSDYIQRSLKTAVKNQGLKIALSHKILRKAGKNETLPDQAKTLLEIGDKAESRILESVGIVSSHTSTQTQNILIDNRTEISPAVERLLMNHLTGNDNIVEMEIKRENSE